MWAAGLLIRRTCTRGFAGRNRARCGWIWIRRSRPTCWRQSWTCGIAEGSVDAVWSSHNLEHLSALTKSRGLSRSSCGCLSSAGRLMITLPDLQQVAEFIVADRLDDVAYVSPAGPITPLDCLFGHGQAIAAGRELMAHRTGFTATTLRRQFERAGFVDVRVTFSLRALGRRDEARCGAWSRHKVCRRSVPCADPRPARIRGRSLSIRPPRSLRPGVRPGTEPRAAQCGRVSTTRGDGPWPGAAARRSDGSTRVGAPPRHAQLHCNAGAARRSLGQLDEAIAAFARDRHRPAHGRCALQPGAGAGGRRFVRRGFGCAARSRRDRACVCRDGMH